MLVGRSVVGIIVMALLYNVGLKEAVWDGITRDTVSPLVFRSFQGAAVQTINYGTTKYLVLTAIAIITSLNPLVTVVMAYLILKEKIQRFEIGVLFFSVIAIIAFSITGDSEEALSKSSTPIWVYYIALSTVPFLAAGGTIAMRKMKKFHEAVVSWYLNLALLGSSLIVVLIL